MTQHRLQGSQSLHHHIPSRASLPSAEAITTVDGCRKAMLSLNTIGPTAPHLRGQIMGMGMEVALGAAIGLQTLQCRQPAIDPRMLLPQGKTLVVSEGGIHALDVGNEHQIGAAWLQSIG